MKPKEELTTLMHGELTISAEQEKANVIGTAKELVSSGVLTAVEAARIYDLTEAELNTRR